MSGGVLGRGIGSTFAPFDPLRQHLQSSRTVLEQKHRDVRGVRVRPDALEREPASLVSATGG